MALVTAGVVDGIFCGCHGLPIPLHHIVHLGPPFAQHRRCHSSISGCLLQPLHQCAGLWSPHHPNHHLWVRGTKCPLGQAANRSCFGCHPKVHWFQGRRYTTVATRWRLSRDVRLHTVLWRCQNAAQDMLSVHAIDGVMCALCNIRESRAAKRWSLHSTLCWWPDLIAALHPRRLPWFVQPWHFSLSHPWSLQVLRMSRGCPSVVHVRQTVEHEAHVHCAASTSRYQSQHAPRSV